MPPKNKKKTKSKRYSCQLCSQIDNSFMIQCHVCDLRYHQKCLNISSAEDPWTCPDCEESQSRLAKSIVSKSEPSLATLGKSKSPAKEDCRSQDTRISNGRSVPETITNNALDNQSQTRNDNRSTRSSISRRTLLQLQRIEEEEQLMKKYLDKKYEILMKDCSSESDRISTDRSSYTQSWVKNQSMQVNPPSTLERFTFASSLNEEDTANQVNQPRGDVQSTQQENECQSFQVRSKSVDEINPRLWIDSRKEFVMKVDQMQFDNTATGNSQQFGLSSNQTAPSKLAEKRNTFQRPPCPEHDAKLYMLNSSEFNRDSMYKKVNNHQKPFEDETRAYELPVQSCRQPMDHKHMMNPGTSVFSNNNWETNQQSQNCRNDQFQNPIVSYSPPNWQRENQCSNFNIPTYSKNQYKSERRDANIRKLAVENSPSFGRRHNETKANYWLEPERSTNNNPHQRQLYESTRVGEPQGKGFEDPDYNRTDMWDVERGYLFNNQDYSENFRANQGHISQVVPEMKNNVDGTSCSNIRSITQPFFDPWLNELKNHQNSFLTKSQIASRQVVDKKLKMFSGNPDEWSQWYRKFKNTSKMCGLTNDENLERLEKCLEGKAERAVSSQLSFPSAVPWIINTLHMLFGRPEVIIKSQINKIKEYPPIKAERLDSLMEFAFEVQNISATIESLERQDHLTDPMLVEELVNKLPAQEKKDWARFKMGKSNVTIKTLAIWLYELAQILSSIATPTTTKPNDQRTADRTLEYRKGDTNHVKGSARFNLHVEDCDEQRVTSNKNSMDVVHENQAESPKKSLSCSICNKECEKVENCPKFKSYTTECRWKAIIENKLCRKCLRRHKFPCRATSTCNENGCHYKQKHHSLLHNNERHNKKSTSETTSLNENVSTSGQNVHLESNHDTLLKIVPAMLHYNGKSVRTFAFLDDGSTATMMEQEIADKLGLTGTPEQLCLIWTKNIHRQERAEKVTLEISGIKESDHRYSLKGIRSVSNLQLPIQSVRKQNLVQKYPYLKDVPMVDYENAVPGIIIGSDYPKLGTQMKVIEGPENDSPIASRTRLGWTVHGPHNASRNIEIINHHKVKVCPYHNELDHEIHQRIKEFFSIETFGVQANSRLNAESKDDQRAMEMLSKLTRRTNGKFETGLLWKQDNISLPDSYPTALKRLCSLEKQGDKFIKPIEEKIADYVKKNYAKKLSPDELGVNQPVWYLPPFGVFHPKKPDKLRMVFDAAAKSKSVSLNSMLLKGPDQLTSLVDILRRFREKAIAICGDIREMYHQIGIRKEDQQFQRFLFRNNERQREPDVYVMTVMTFGATCSPCAAQYVKNVNANEFKNTHPEAVKAIVDNHYVDDMMDGADTEEEAIKLAQDVTMIHAHGGFEIRNFLSNSANVLRAIGNNGPNDVKDIEPNTELKTERVLGMWWDMKHDVFTFSLKFSPINEDILNGKRWPTKREALRTLMSIFDPLGFLSHYLIHLKIIIQEIWRSEIGWDESLPNDNLKDRWKQWIEILPGVEGVKIPRLYSQKMSPGTPKSLQMHVFVDASEDAFSAVIYLRIEDDYGVDCVLIGSKAKVAPLKYLSIPRKELQAAVLGSRLQASIVNGQTFKINRRIFWSDSETVLSWLNSNHRKYSQFVAHRVGEILENTDVNEWRWIPTKENVADEATKWSKTPTFESSNRWFSGPEFLRMSEDQWPKKKNIKVDVEEEMKMHFAHSYLVAPQLIDATRFSNWNRMVRALAYAIRFGKIVRKGEKVKTLTQEDLLKAENTIFRQAQFEGFPSEMVTLHRNKTLPVRKHVYIEKPSTLFDGSPYLDAEDVLRMKNRIDGAHDLSQDTKRPIVLPGPSRITMLLVHHYHVKYFHRNHETVVNEIRQRFYIAHLRVLLKKVRRNCQWCKVKRAKPKEPQMADLPTARLASFFRPYSYVGIDFFGPMDVMIGRRTEKRWGVLFTCLTIRAIHIELAPSLDTDTCILCIQNFVYEHGAVFEFHSDCGTNFKGADNELTREMEKIDQDQLDKKFTSTYTKWIFNPPSAAHMGGAWERLIRTVKSSLYEILPTRTPKEKLLYNLLKGIQNVINSRPLTYIPLENIEDEALTPNHFLHGTSNGGKPPCKLELDGPYLRKSWKESQRLTDLFWKRFIKEYLPSIARRTKWFKKVEPIKPGDIVLIVDEENPRNTYPKAKVLETKIGSNNQVRRAKVEIISEVKTDQKGQIIKVRKNHPWRPAHKLAVLDVIPKQTEFGLADLEVDLDIKTGGSVKFAGSNNTGMPNENIDEEKMTVTTERKEHKN